MFFSESDTRRALLQYRCLLGRISKWAHVIRGHSPLRSEVCESLEMNMLVRGFHCLLVSCPQARFDQRFGAFPPLDAVAGLIGHHLSVARGPRDRYRPSEIQILSSEEAELGPSEVQKFGLPGRVGSADRSRNSTRRHVCVYIYIYTHIHVYINMCIHIYIYIYMYRTHALSSETPRPRSSENHLPRRVASTCFHFSICIYRDR